MTGPALGPEGSLIERARAGGTPLEIVPALRRAIHPWRDAASYRAIGQAIRRFQPDAVHTHSGKAGLLGRLAAWRLKVPAIVHTVHGAPFHPYQSAAARATFRACERFAAARCDALVSVADAMTTQLVAAGVAPAEKFQTIYSGMEVEPLLAAGGQRAALRRELGYGDEHVVVGKIARLFHLKGHADLIDAAQRALAGNPQLRFLLVGDGILGRQLRDDIAARGLAPYFQFTGLVAPERIPAYLAAMDIVAHASLREGLARVLPQALIVGRSVISYDIDGAREVVIPGETGELLPPGDVAGLAEAIVRLAADPALRPLRRRGPGPVHRSLSPRDDDGAAAGAVRPAAGQLESRAVTGGERSTGNRRPISRQSGQGGAPRWSLGRQPRSPSGFFSGRKAACGPSSWLGRRPGRLVKMIGRSEGPPTGGFGRPPARRHRAPRPDPPAASAAVPHSSQDYVGRYRLLNLLRQGKTCQVWDVMDDTTTQRYAIKLLLAEFRRDRVEVGYMRHEHRVGRPLNHRRVIKIFEFGIDRDNVYLAMELFAAPNLKQVIQGNFDSIAPLARNSILQAAEGLSYFHNQGWVHRDIKPDNFLMKSDGEVKLIDFALAAPRYKWLKGLRHFFRLNRQIQGTRSYMSPEQIRGKRLDERADIYSFGCVMFELLSGKLPFTGTSTADLLNKHLRLPPPSIQAVNRNVSDQAAELIKRLMAKRPQSRPRDMAEFMREFHSIELFKEPPAKVRR